MIYSAYAWMINIRVTWELMSISEKNFALWNGIFDIFLVAVFLTFVWIGLTDDPAALVFWVPFIGVTLFFRYRQTRDRWRGRSRARIDSPE